jgi:hypothetical protein
MTMNTAKTLFLAAVTALTLGTGAAMARCEGPSAPGAVHISVQVQPGSSHVATTRSRNPYDVTTHPELDRSIGDSGG